MNRRIAVVLASAALCWATAGGASQPSQPTDSSSNYSTPSNAAGDNSASEIADYDAISAQIDSVLQVKPIVADGCEGSAPDCDGNGAVCCGEEWRCCGTACPAC